MSSSADATRQIDERAAALGPAATAELPRIHVSMHLPLEEPEVPQQDSSDLKALRVLGIGGMGRVLLARQMSLGRDVAIKTLWEEEESPVRVQGLLREARIMGALEHPGIVPVHALGLDEAGKPILVMKRVEGVSFRILLDDSAHPIWKTFSSGGEDRLENSLNILMRVCESLSFAHNRGVIHRDIKPDNIMVGAYGEVYLCDWGAAARLDELPAENGPILGSPAYMAPEMLFGQREDERTDVYLLGATLHDVLTGRPRHECLSTLGIFQSMGKSEPIVYDAKVPPDLAALCNRATSTNPALRPASADAFRKELAAHLRRRSAMVLCEAALERMRALETAIAGLDADKLPNDLPVVYRHATEARFGFVQSLRVEPALEAAKTGLQRTLAALFDIELRQKHLDSATALLEEMTHPPEEFRARLSAARKIAEQDRAEAERLRAIAREFDPAVDARPRMMGLAVLIVGVFLVVVATGRRQSVDDITNEKLVWLAVFLMAAAIVVFGVFRKRLLTTSFNRRTVAVFVASTVFLVLDRLLGWHTGHSVPAIITNDMVVMAAMLTVAAITLERRLVTVVGLYVVVCIAMLLSPENAPRLFTATGLATCLMYAWIWKVPLQRKTNEKQRITSS